MTNPLRARALVVVLALSLAAMARADSADPEGSDVLGKRLPDWGDLRFVDAPVHRKPADFKGKVLVIRFWTDQCPFCRASAPVLTGWGDKYRDKGLVVIDIYHPKPPHAVTDDEVRAYAKRIGLRGLLAVDERWSALEKLWLRGQDRAYTSATLLVDREGVVRAVHRGGYLSQDGSDDDRQQAQAFERSLRTLMENDRL
ncbi:MAG TPA: TlpA disulfide reductase family protein [Candidatus Eisenbacteria bacterium]|nr:TlpA disulfide reductase family protein [Candidatus Eisenbacteria bacterium]